MEEPVVTAAQLAFSVRLKGSSDISENTKHAQAAPSRRGARPASCAARSIYGLT